MRIIVCNEHKVVSCASNNQSHILTFPSVLPSPRYASIDVDQEIQPLRSNKMFSLTVKTFCCIISL